MDQVGLSDFFSPVLSYSQDMFKGIVAVALVGTIVCLWRNHLNRQRNRDTFTDPNSGETPTTHGTEDNEPGAPVSPATVSAQRDRLGREIRFAQRVTHLLRNSAQAILRGRYLDLIFIICDFFVSQFRGIPDRLRIAYTTFSIARRLTRIGA